jgi:hypothetical protein
MLLRTTVAVLFAAVLFSPGATFAMDVQTGSDPVVHVPPSFWDFGPSPLPAEYFGPGSDPFDGGVPADASIIPASPHCPGDLGNTSMLVERKDVAVLPGIASSDTVDIEIIELSLVSASPIIVTYFGGLDPELWDVEITLSPSFPSTGTMTIRQEHAEGGTFDASILLEPYFTFRRVSDSTVRTLDGAGTYEDLLNTVGVPWVYSDASLNCPVCVSNFMPGHDGASPVAFPFSGTSSQHTVRTSCSHTSIPTLSQWGLVVFGMLLLAATALALRQRRAA